MPSKPLSDPKIERVWTAKEIAVKLNRAINFPQSSREVLEDEWIQYLAKCTRLMAAFEKFKGADYMLRSSGWDLVLSAFETAIETKDE